MLARSQPDDRIAGRSLADRYAALSIALDAALQRSNTALDRCLIDPSGALSRGTAARVERHGDFTTVRSLDTGGKIVLRARAIATPSDTPVPQIAGERVAPSDFIAWLEGLTLDGAAFARDGGDVVLAADAAVIPLAPGTIANPDGIRSALTAAFGIPALAEAHEGLVPTQIDSLWRKGPLPVVRAVARLAGSTTEGHRVDCLLIGADDRPVMVLRGVSFGQAAESSMVLLDPDDILAGGVEQAEARLLHELVARAAIILGADPTDVASDQRLLALGFDSLGLAQLHAQATMALGIDIPIDSFARVTTLRDLARVAAHELSRRHVPPQDDFGVAQFVNPAMARRLRASRLDRAYVRGSGSILTDSEGRDVIDFVAQYGALPFGHNPPDIWAALDGVRQAQFPTLAGLSLPLASARLAERLVALAPPVLDRAFFCSSGAEAIEAAIKLCRAATGRNGILSTHGGYHGLTLGALSATGRAAYQAPFGAPLPDFDKVPYGDLAALGEALDQHPARYAAFIVEPIQGEGGIVEPPAGYLAGAAELCRARGVAFVLDEVQTGLGRCGTLFASCGREVVPDVVTLAKALGGGLVPIGAMLYRSELATEAFMLRHGSTFANNALGCAAAMATLDRLTADDGRLLKQVAQQGAAVKAELEALRARHPDIIRDVRGRGYLLGVGFSAEPASYQGSISSFLCQSEAFGALLTSYLLNRHGVRVAPTMSEASVLRIEPALDIPPSLFARLMESFAALADALDRGDSRAVFGHVLGIDPAATRPFTGSRMRTRPTGRSTDATDGRFAFLIHLMGVNDLERFDPSLAGLSPETFAEARATAPDLLDPAPLATVELHAPDGRRAVGDLILVPHTTQELLDMPEGRARQIIGGAVSLAARRGAHIVGLGGFTSVVTGGGRTIADHVTVPLTTGNALTALTAVRGIEAAMGMAGVAPQDATAMIFGAFGSIGGAMTKLLARHVARLCLIVRNEDATTRMQRAEHLRASLLSYLTTRAGLRGARKHRGGDARRRGCPRPDRVRVGSGAALAAMQCRRHRNQRARTSGHRR